MSHAGCGDGQAARRDRMHAWRQRSEAAQTATRRADCAMSTAGVCNTRQHAPHTRPTHASRHPPTNPTASFKDSPSSTPSPTHNTQPPSLNLQHTHTHTCPVLRHVCIPSLVAPAAWLGLGGSPYPPLAPPPPPAPPACCFCPTSSATMLPSSAFESRLSPLAIFGGPPTSMFASDCDFRGGLCPFACPPAAPDPAAAAAAAAPSCCGQTSLGALGDETERAGGGSACSSGPLLSTAIGARRPSS
eukprot:725592-Rhodomonas_salina.1